VKSSIIIISISMYNLYIYFSTLCQTAGFVEVDVRIMPCRSCVDSSIRVWVAGHRLADAYLYSWLTNTRVPIVGSLMKMCIKMNQSRLLACCAATACPSVTKNERSSAGWRKKMECSGIIWNTFPAHFTSRDWLICNFWNYGIFMRESFVCNYLELIF
jgi:hypothetical protein